MHLTLNGRPCEVDATCLRELVGDLPTGHAVAVNGEVVPRADHARHVVVDGDIVEVVGAVAGG